MCSRIAHDHLARKLRSISVGRRGLAANTLVAALGEALGGKGGGSASFAQGRGGPVPDLQGVLEGVLEATPAARP